MDSIDSLYLAQHAIDELVDRLSRNEMKWLSVNVGPGHEMVDGGVGGLEAKH